MFPEENDRGTESVDPTHSQVVMHFNQFDSDEELEEEEDQNNVQHNQYQLLSQDMNELEEEDEDQDEESQNEEEELSRMTWTADFENSNEQDTATVNSIVDTTNQSSRINNPQRQTMEPVHDSEREWDRKDDLPDRPQIELNQEHIESIKGCMSSILIHPSAVPEWASVVPEEKITQFIYAKLKLNATKPK